MSAFCSILEKQENPGRSVPIDPEDEKREAKEYEERKAREEAECEEKEDLQQKKSEQSHWGTLRDMMREIVKSGS